MNKVILLVLLMPFSAFGQIIVNFESGRISDWVQSPDGHWNADNTASISGICSLHHSYDNSASGNDLIGLSVSNYHPGEGIARWSFLIRYGCEPSSLNNWAIWVMSDTDPSSFLNGHGPDGFSVGINQTGYDDTLRLWKVKNGTFYPVINSRINWQTDIGAINAVIINLERSPAGQWSLQVLRPNNVLIGSSNGFDAELFNPGWFVLNYKYTSTRDRLIWIDDIRIEGVFYEDREPPVVSGYEIAGENALLVSFNEAISEGSLTASNFLIEKVNNKVTEIINENSFTCLLEFERQFVNKTLNRLKITNLCDKSQNCTNEAFVEFTPAWVEPGDVIISEIMTDPLPVVSLPGKEYLELHNRTKFAFNTNDWVISDGSQTSLFPETIIQPGEYVVVCSAQDTGLFNRYGKTTGIKPFPALTDDGKILGLKDTSGNLIHGIEYSPDWYVDVLKKEGGWSLEIIDKDYPFFQEGNWHASVSKNGGTPGKPNSVSQFNPDFLFAGIENVYPSDSNSIILKLSETAIGLQDKFECIKINSSGINVLHPVDPLLRTYEIIPESPLQGSTVYTLAIGAEVTDFAGNNMERSDFGFGLPEKVVKSDILFNELLFNPLQEGSDYIELYNCSDKILDAYGLFLVSVNDESSDTSTVFSVSSEGRCILPGDYYVITGDREWVLGNYPLADGDHIFEIASLPSMSDDKGHLILYNRELEKIDEVFYNEKMHFSLLQGNQGISLEKIRNRGSSIDRSLWHSASEISSWGTPGAPNSVCVGEAEGEDNIIFSSTKITPDNDGNEDFLMIDLTLTGIGNVVSISIFDETGHFVKKLTDNLFAGSEASVVWNGTGEDEKLVNTGIYVILISVFDDKGKVEKCKRVCTVIR